MGTRADHPGRGILTPRHAEPKKHTLIARITCWFTGAFRQDFAATEDRTKTTSPKTRNEAETAEKSAEIGRPATVAQTSKEATDAACEDAVLGAAIDGQEPLIQITTQAGRVHYMRREAWQTAKENAEKDVFLCEWNGEPVNDGDRKKTLRVSTLPKCKLTPMPLPKVDGWLRSEQDSEPRLGL